MRPPHPVLAPVVLLAVAGLLSAPAPAAAAAPQTYGLWQYAAPDGAAQDGKVSRTWQRVEGRSFCQISLYLAVVGKGDPRTDFDADWLELAAGRGAAGPAPSPASSGAPNGWTRLEGEREETTTAVGRYRVRQVTFSGFDRRMSAVTTSNDEALCGGPARAFLASLVPLRPADASPATAPPPASPGRPGPAGALPATELPPNAGPPPALTAQTWYKTAANYSQWGTKFTLGEIQKLGHQGYARRTWRFGNDGRYRYRLEVWSMNVRPAELSGIEETGIFRVEGDRVVVEPDSAVAYAEERSSHRRLRESPTKTARTVYSGRMHYLSGMGAWYLVLAPVDGRPTDREGSFDGHPSFPGAYLYGPPPKVGG